MGCTGQLDQEEEQEEEEGKDEGSKKEKDEVDRLRPACTLGTRIYMHIIHSPFMLINLLLRNRGSQKRFLKQNSETLAPSLMAAKSTKHAFS